MARRSKENEFTSTASPPPVDLESEYRGPASITKSRARPVTCTRPPTDVFSVVPPTPPAVPTERWAYAEAEPHEKTLVSKASKNGLRLGDSPRVTRTVGPAIKVAIVCG